MAKKIPEKNPIRQRNQNYDIFFSVENDELCNLPALDVVGVFDLELSGLSGTFAAAVSFTVGVDGLRVK